MCFEALKIGKIRILAVLDCNTLIVVLQLQYYIKLQIALIIPNVPKNNERSERAMPCYNTICGIKGSEHMLENVKFP